MKMTWMIGVLSALVIGHSVQAINLRCSNVFNPSLQSLRLTALSADGKFAAIAQGTPPVVKIVGLTTPSYPLVTQTLQSLTNLLFIPGRDILVAEGLSERSHAQSELIFIPLHSATLRLQGLETPPPSLTEPGLRQILGHPDCRYVLLIGASTLIFDTQKLQIAGTLSYGSQTIQKATLSPVGTQFAASVANSSPGPRQGAIVIADLNQPQLARHSYPYSLESTEDIQPFENPIDLQWNATGTALLTINRPSQQFLYSNFSGDRIRELYSPRFVRESLIIGGAVLRTGDILIAREKNLADGEPAILKASIFSEDNLQRPKSTFKIPLESPLYRGSDGLTTYSPELNSFFEMQNGKIWIFVFTDRLLVVDPQDLDHTFAIHPPQMGSALNPILSAVKISETTLIMSDQMVGAIRVNVETP